MSVLLGLGFDALLQGVHQIGWAAPADGHGLGGHGPPYIAIGSALLLSGLLAYLLGLRLKVMIPRRRDTAPETDLLLRVEGMSCQHCVAGVKKSLEGLEAVREATPELSTGLVRIRGDHLDVTALIRAVEKAGFRALPPPQALICPRPVICCCDPRPAPHPPCAWGVGRR